MQLSDRAVCDRELLATGAFSPLDRFMGQADYQCVLDDMRLANGDIFPVLVTLPVKPSPVIGLDRDVALRDAKNDLLAVMTIEEARGKRRRGRAKSQSMRSRESPRKTLQGYPAYHPT